MDGQSHKAYPDLITSYNQAPLTAHSVESPIDTKITCSKQLIPVTNSREVPVLMHKEQLPPTSTLTLWCRATNGRIDSSLPNLPLGVVALCVSPVSVSFRIVRSSLLRQHEHVDFFRNQVRVEFEDGFIQRYSREQSFQETNHQNQATSPKSQHRDGQSMLRCATFDQLPRQTAKNRQHQDRQQRVGCSRGNGQLDHRSAQNLGQPVKIDHWGVCISI
jgi:hypothetical protein